MSGYKVLGTSDLDTCQCCGREDLRMTIAIDTTDVDGNAEGNVAYFGTYCAALYTGLPVKRITEAAAIENRERAIAEEVARRHLDRYGDVDGWNFRPAVERYIDANWRHTSGMTGDEILAELRTMTADARAVLGLDEFAMSSTPDDDTETTEETPMKPVQSELFDVLPLLGQTTVEEQVAAAEAETAEPTLPGDGTLFALRVTDTPDTTTGALFGLGI